MTNELAETAILSQCREIDNIHNITKSFMKAYFRDDIYESYAERSAEDEISDRLYELIDQNQWKLVLEVYMEVRDHDNHVPRRKRQYLNYMRMVCEEMMRLLNEEKSTKSIEHVEELIMTYNKLAYVMYDAINEMSYLLSNPEEDKSLYDELKNRPALKDLFSDIV